MKAISLYEPWATLIALGKKRYETRSWSTTYRGPLLICASIKRPPLHETIGVLYRAGINSDELKPGRAVAIVELIGVHPTKALVYAELGEDEQYFGDFSSGRFAWQLKNIRRILKPPPIKGRQGLFDIPDDLIKNLDTYDPI